MLLYISIIFIPIVYSVENRILQHIAQSTNKSVNTINETDLHTKNLTLVSEGGPIVAKTQLLSLISDNNTALLSLDKELSKSKERPSVGRKGVEYNENTNQSVNIEISKENVEQDKILNSSNVVPKFTNVTVSPPMDADNVTAHNTTLLSPKNSNKNTTVITPENKNTTVTTHSLPTETPILKPTLVSYEALANADHQNSISKSKMLNLKPSVNTPMQDQLQPPNKDVNSNKVHNANGHPGMVMPLVITILVVPVFAVLGYMALKRGQEAWKNRHYKRMDFLLDGMYNE